MGEHESSIFHVARFESVVCAFRCAFFSFFFKLNMVLQTAPSCRHLASEQARSFISPFESSDALLFVFCA